MGPFHEARDNQKGDPGRARRVAWKITTAPAKPPSFLLRHFSLPSIGYSLGSLFYSRFRQPPSKRRHNSRLRNCCRSRSRSRLHLLSPRNCILQVFVRLKRLGGEAEPPRPIWILHARTRWRAATLDPLRRLVCLLGNERDKFLARVEILRHEPWLRWKLDLVICDECRGWKIEVMRLCLCFQPAVVYVRLCARLVGRLVTDGFPENMGLHLYGPLGGCWL